MGGFGEGDYPAGTEVHVFSAVLPFTEVVTGWNVDGSPVSTRREWHEVFTMPAANMQVDITRATRTRTLTNTTYAGSTTRAKAVYHLVPSNPVGIIFLMHGTGGNAGFITKGEPTAFWMTAVERGYGVVASESEESVAGDLDGNNKEQWDVAVATGNTDFANLDLLVAGLRNQLSISNQVPLYVVGMSNGGAMAVSLGAIPQVPTAAAAYARLRFKAVVSYCASGVAQVAAATTTPTAWFMCGNDTNGSVGMAGNLEAEASSAALANRGVGTDFGIHPASPLHDGRFTRVDGVDLQTSSAIVAELRAAGLLDSNGYLLQTPAEVEAAISAAPGQFPAFLGLSVARRREAGDQLAAAYADHQFFSDWSHRTLDFLDAHR